MLQRESMSWRGCCRRSAPHSWRQRKRWHKSRQDWLTTGLERCASKLKSEWSSFRKTHSFFRIGMGLDGWLPLVQAVCFLGSAQCSKHILGGIVREHSSLDCHILIAFCSWHAVGSCIIISEILLNMCGFCAVMLTYKVQIALRDILRQAIPRLTCVSGSCQAPL